MRSRLLAIGAALGLPTPGYGTPANAIGCIGNGAAGAAAGHTANHALCDPVLQEGITEQVMSFRLVAS